MYEYQATVVRVIDGDTVDVDLDLGLDCHLHTRLRLHHINAPEKNTPEGKAAADYLRGRLPTDRPILVQTSKDRREKYGRYLAVIVMNDGTTVNQEMIDKGHAVGYEGGRR